MAVHAAFHCCIVMLSAGRACRGGSRRPWGSIFWLPYRVERRSGIHLPCLLPPFPRSPTLVLIPSRPVGYGSGPSPFLTPLAVAQCTLSPWPPWTSCGLQRAVPPGDIPHCPALSIPIGYTNSGDQDHPRSCFFLFIFLVKKWAVNSRLNVLCAHFFTFNSGKSILLSEMIG